MRSTATHAVFHPVRGRHPSFVLSREYNRAIPIGRGLGFVTSDTITAGSYSSGDFETPPVHGTNVSERGDVKKGLTLRRKPHKSSVSGWSNKFERKRVRIGVIMSCKERARTTLPQRLRYR